jgi:exodeoxyribonuclease VII small subunit
MSPSNPEKFEESLSRLEEILRQLETGELPLGESLKAFEEGIKLTKVCHEMLDTAQKRIETLLRDQQGKLSAKPLDLEGGEGE